MVGAVADRAIDAHQEGPVEDWLVWLPCLCTWEEANSEAESISKGGEGGRRVASTWNHYRVGLGVAVVHQVLPD